MAYPLNLRLIKYSTMRTILLKQVRFILFLLFIPLISSAQPLYVQTRPVMPPVYMTEVNMKGYILVEEEWQPEDGQYRYTGCRWIKMRKGYAWKPGYWKRHPKHGERWVSGRWINGKPKNG